MVLISKSLNYFTFFFQNFICIETKYVVYVYEFRFIISKAIFVI